MSPSDSAAFPPHGRRPGALLRAKRIEHGWSVPDVASALRLSVSQLEALEEDNYAKLPGGIYVRGYWKNYASLFGLPVEEFTGVDGGASASASANTASADKAVDAAGAAAPESEPESDAESASEPPLVYVLHKKRRRFALWFALLSVVFLGIIWYFDYSTDGSDLGSTTDVAAVSTDENVTPEDAASALLPKQGEQIEPAPVSEIVADTDTPTKIPALPLSTVSPGEIIFVVGEDSWIEVQDNAEELLLYQTIRSGRQVRVEGEPPFAVFLGNAGSVAVEYRGKPVTFTAGDSGLYARFTLGDGR